MKVLHIVNWYPNNNNPYEAIWIKRHIESLTGYLTDQFVLHIQVKPSSRLKLIKGNLPEGIQFILEVPFSSWFMIEIFTSALLFYYLFKFRNRNYDVINFHIAYPLLVYYFMFKKIIKVPVIITEHWSAYHFNFGTYKTLHRAKNIFGHGIPVITVSQALAHDIKNFSGSSFPSNVVPNVVDSAVFYPNQSNSSENFFFMASQWKWPKRPIIIFEAFRDFVKSNPTFKLKVGGYGPDYLVMTKWVKDNSMYEQIQFLGLLEQERIASYMRKCLAFIHCSEYETFSVVCAEAISCHAPVLASRVGSIPEIVKDEGLLIDSFDPLDWRCGMETMITSRFTFSNSNPFSLGTVGRLYYKALQDCINAASR